MGAESAVLLSDIAQARVVCMNPRGVGGSSPARPEDSTLERIVEDLEVVRRDLGIGPWVFWGISGGSYLGHLYARRHPEALSGLLLLSAGASFGQTVADSACALSPSFPPWREHLVAANLLGGQGTGQGGTDEANATEWQRVDGAGWVLRRRNGPALLVSPEEPSPVMARMMPVLHAFDARGWLGSVRVPTLVMCGTADPLVPLAQARAAHAAIPGSEFLALEGAGHSLLTERTQEVAAAVRRFLSGRVRG
jgi:pimeloyl-ACP methyl ester carboxylesterase